MKYAIAATLVLGFTIGVLVSGQTQTVGPLGISESARNLVRVYTEKNRKEHESDAVEMFILMGYAARGEAPPSGLLERVVNRANSGKMGGFFDTNTLKTYGAITAYDFYVELTKHRQEDSNRDRQIANLRNELDALKIEVANLRKAP